MVTFEAIIWYLLVFDSLTYAVLTFTKGKLHDKVSHWPMMKWVPLNPLFSLMYLALVAWVGFALFRLGIIF